MEELAENTVGRGRYGGDTEVTWVHAFTALLLVLNLCFDSWGEIILVNSRGEKVGGVLPYRQHRSKPETMVLRVCFQ